MATRFCEHLEDYGAQFATTEASYHQCVNLLDRMISDGPTPELVALLTTALQDWSTEDGKLREMLVAEVKAGHVRVPLALVRRHETSSPVRSRRFRHRGHLVCAQCRFVLPRLVYPEWQIAHNGVASFRGQELTVPTAC